MSRTGVFVGSLLGRASRALAETSIVEEKNIRTELYLHQKRPVEPIRDVASVAVAHEHGVPQSGVGGVCGEEPRMDALTVLRDKRQLVVTET